jgi:hypothetical protein
VDVVLSRQLCQPAIPLDFIPICSIPDIEYWVLGITLISLKDLNRYNLVLTAQGCNGHSVAAVERRTQQGSAEKT